MADEATFGAKRSHYMGSMVAEVGSLHWTGSLFSRGSWLRFARAFLQRLSFLPETPENFQCAVVLAIKTALMAVDQVEVPRVVAKGAESEHGASGWIFVDRRVGLAARFMDDAGGFDGRETQQTPMRYGHFLHQQALGGGFGLEFGGEGVEEPGEALAGLVSDQDSVAGNLRCVTES